MIIWKDLFKPRYALVVDMDRMPMTEKCEFFYFPCVKRKPYLRPLDVSFNEFYNGLSTMDNMVLCGSKHTLKSLYGIGSCLPHNINKPNIFKQ